MNTIDLLSDYYKKQSDILKLLRESNNIIETLLNEEDEECKVPLKVCDKDGKWYMFRFRSNRQIFGRYLYKYIQVSPDALSYDSDLDCTKVDRHYRPRIVTDISYRAGMNVLFKTKEDAKKFFTKFMNSKARRNVSEYNYGTWELVAIKNYNYESTCELYKDNEYGYYYM